MKVIKCLIVDDEPPAIRLIEKYLSRVPFLELVSSTTSALTALIEEGGIDLVFMDIQMPDLTGLQLSKLVKGKQNYFHDCLSAVCHTKLRSGCC
jgi:CheY-like chemotaxis protein